MLSIKIWMAWLAHATSVDQLRSGFPLQSSILITNMWQTIIYIFLEVGIIIVILNERIRCLSMTDHIVHVFLAIPPLHFGTYWTYRYPASANEEPGCQEYISGEYINAFTSSKRALESATKPKACKSITMSIIREEPSSLNKEVNSSKPNNLFWWDLFYTI